MKRFALPFSATFLPLMIDLPLMCKAAVLSARGSDRAVGAYGRVPNLCRLPVSGQ